MTPEKLQRCAHAAWLLIGLDAGTLTDDDLYLVWRSTAQERAMVRARLAADIATLVRQHNERAADGLTA